MAQVEFRKFMSKKRRLSKCCDESNCVVAMVLYKYMSRFIVLSEADKMIVSKSRDLARRCVKHQGKDSKVS
jgi:hypothetical protein